MPANRITLRTLALPAIALAIVALLIHFRPAKKTDPVSADGAKSADSTPTGSPESAPFSFMRPAYLPVPFEQAMRKGPIPDRVERLTDRALNYPLDLRNRALDDLAKLKKPHEIEQFVQLADAEWRRDPMRGYVFLPTLAQMHHPQAAAIVEEAATHSSNMIRVDAARSLGLVDDEAAVERLEKMLTDPYEGVRTSAIRALIDMKCPAALGALQRYAKGGPEDRIQHVLFRLGSDTENPDAIPILREYLNATGTVRLVALRMLAKFGDPSALDILYDMIDRGDATSRHTGLQYLLEAPRDLLEIPKFESCLEDSNGEIRRTTAEIMLRMAQAKALSKEDADHVAQRLEKHLTDLDFRTRAASIAAMFAIGRKDVVEPYEKAILTANGPGLHDALEVTTVWCKDANALPIVLERMKAGATTDSTEDHARLITALGDLNDIASLDAYLGVIRGAKEGEAKDASKVELSKRAVLHVSTLGPSIQNDLLAIARDKSATVEARLRALDALRGINGVDCAGPLVEIAADATAPHAIRMAAIDTLPFLVGIDLFDVVSDALDRFEDRELRMHAYYVLFDYA